MGQANLRRACLVRFVGSHDALVTLKNIDFEQDADPTSEVALHEGDIVLADLGEDVLLVVVVQLVLNALDNLAQDEVFVDEKEKEAFEESVWAEEAELGHCGKHLEDEFAEELGLVQHLLV